MNVTFNLQLDPGKQEKVRAELEHLPDIGRIDRLAGCAELLVVHVPRSAARRLQARLEHMDGVLSATLGAVARAI